MKFSRRTVPTLNSPNLTAQLLSMLNDVMGNLSAIFDRGISFDANIDAVSVSFTSNVAPNTEDTVAHALGRVPVGFIVTSLDRAATVYAGGTAFTSTQLFLRTSVASAVVRLIVF